MTDTTHPSLGFLLMDAGRLLRRRFEEDSRDLPMTGAQLRLVARLSKNEGIGQAALAGLLEMEPMTVSRHVDRMMAAGLVERVQDPDDRRARQLYTTEKSRKLLAPMRERAAAIFDEAQAGLSKDERQILHKALETIIGNLGCSLEAVEGETKKKKARRDARTREPAGGAV
ncbi:MarR family winged helix-turn-helix transcriptional regulator [Fulvimarina sp. MAC3]|uniref:MarR family winged helix-turn-helix transcriptional regulator n=1 Tax=Fulvimarina sp. MAC3 TaxID=3148887 RepID=UPI0031FCE611